MQLGQAMWRLLLVLVVLRTASHVDGGRHTFWKTWIQVVFPHFNDLQLRLRFMPQFLRFPCWGVGAKCACLSNFSAPLLRKLLAAAIRPMAGVGMCCRSTASGYLGWCCWCSVMKSDRMRWRCSEAMCCRLPTSRQDIFFPSNEFLVILHVFIKLIYIVFVGVCEMAGGRLVDTAQLYENHKVTTWIDAFPSDS